MSVPKIVVHTDVFLEHLTGTKRPSVLRRAMSMFFCYTTVFEAIELFSLAKTEKERETVRDSMAAMKILGLNAKSAGRYGELLALNKKLRAQDVFVAGLCLESRLPILTNNRRDFSGIKGLRIVPTKMINGNKTAEEILRHVE